MSGVSSADTRAELVARLASCPEDDLERHRREDHLIDSSSVIHMFRMGPVLRRFEEGHVASRNGGPAFAVKVAFVVWSDVPASVHPLKGGEPIVHAVFSQEEVMFYDN